MKIFCIGRNYLSHIQELNNALPSEPVIFMKPPTALLKEKFFFIPEFSNNIHHEIELVIKIGKNGKHIQPEFAERYISQITVGIDFTARDVQDKLKQKSLPWELAKAFDNSAVMGNFETISQFENIQNINFSLKKNEQIVQQGNSSQMIFSVKEIIVYLSKFFTLQQGDLIFTGTPDGVGKINANDKLEGFIEDKKCFEIVVK
jgi:2-keto-4-pentenoate hydratase/2-oxohepta-3-ene-1,7-dioic acid hydratase in catechol pathway